MRILLVYPDARKEIIGWGDLGAVAEPLTLEYIGTGAKLDGHEVKILDLLLYPQDLDSHLQEYWNLDIESHMLCIERHIEV